MAKKDTSKTNVAARALLKQQQSICRFCGKTTQVVRLLGPNGRASMFRKCCAEAGIAAPPSA